MKNSKRNLAARQKELAERLDRSWQPQREDPVLESGNIHYEVSGRVNGTNSVVWGCCRRWSRRLVLGQRSTKSSPDTLGFHDRSLYICNRCSPPSCLEPTCRLDLRRP